MPEKKKGASSRIAQMAFRPVTRDNLDDLRRFSKAHGKFGYCSCMRWRLRSGEFQKSSKEQRAAGLNKMVKSGIPVGVLAYDGGEPVGWCSIAPRESYEGLERYKKLARIDDEPVWAVACFFLDSTYRRKGLVAALLRAAVEYAVEAGAAIIEGYPVEKTAASYTYMGSEAAFKAAGFVNATPSGRERKIVRYFAGE